ncbi:MAG: Glutathione S-transferase [Myxococcales bacterium]|nr:Glutathione S-transferase [Myxococcales bacterium]
MAAYTLFYTPGACSISPHIALREAGLDFQLEKVDLRAKKLASGDDYTGVSAKGYVPALRLPDGKILTEGAVMVQYIADQAPKSQLAPPAGTMERYRLMEWLNFIATELHKGTSPLYSPVANDDYKANLKQRLDSRWNVLAAGIKGKPFLMGDKFTIADGYAFYVLRGWIHPIKETLTKWPDLADYYERLAARPTVAAALEAEGITS